MMNLYEKTTLLLKDLEQLQPNKNITVCDINGLYEIAKKLYEGNNEPCETIQKNIFDYLSTKAYIKIVAHGIGWQVCYK